MTEYSIQEARTFANLDYTYKAALNDATIFEALCSDPETIRSLIDVFTLKVEHLETQLDTRSRKVNARMVYASAQESEEALAIMTAEHVEWEAKVKALLRSTQFHLKQALRRARLLWDDPIKVLQEIDDMLTSNMSDADVLDAIAELVGTAIEEIEVTNEPAA